MELTRKQEEALKLAIQRYNNKEPYTVIAGLAGTGKSTLVRFIVEALNLTPDQVAYISFTGKAAQVLRSKGCPDAMTAHKFLYKFSINKKTGRFVRWPKPTQELQQYKLVVVDEVSMLGQELWELLLSHHIHVIACGDPMQLPAITEGTTVLNTPDIFLDEIMRQALESEIIRLSLDIREGKELQPFKGKEVNVLRKRDFDPSMLFWADQTLCATNANRFKLNRMYREMKFGYVPSEPQIGERIIFTHNAWNIASTNGDALVNGTTGFIRTLTHKPAPVYGEYAIADIETDDGTGAMFEDILLDWKLLTTGKTTVNKDNFRKFMGKNALEKPQEAVYSYAITTHKSQGSEFPKVLVIEESFPYEAQEHTRWLYTACTRPIEKLTLLLKH